MTKDTLGNYEVGYGKPPQNTQWKKGQSGNPSGKRKKAESLQSKLARVAGEEVSLQFNGESITMPRDEAMIYAVFQKAMKGAQPSVRYITDMINRGEATEAVAPRLMITPGNIIVLRTRAVWMGIVEQAEAEMQEQNRPEPRDYEEEDDDASRF